MLHGALADSIKKMADVLSDSIKKMADLLADSIKGWWIEARNTVVKSCFFSFKNICISHALKAHNHLFG